MAAPDQRPFSDLGVGGCSKLFAEHAILVFRRRLIFCCFARRRLIILCRPLLVRCTSGWDCDVLLVVLYFNLGCSYSCTRVSGRVDADRVGPAGAVDHGREYGKFIDPTDSPGTATVPRRR